MYVIKPAAQTPSLNGEPACPIWASAPSVSLEHFHRRSSEHRPRVEAKLMYQERDLFLYFRVEDRYVRAVRGNYQDNVCRDSCVEFFVRPKADKGYFNFEINAGGVLLLYYITDPTKTDKGFREWRPVEWRHAQDVEIYSSLPRRIEPELREPTTWSIKVRIPIRMLEAYVGPIGELQGQTWQANFYKCADETSHPHWASWQAVGDPLNFHKPECFAPICFA